uniref:Ig-like domain-containing protein n=1 Tax=Romanomermis culicivorax TaxID=13658 RepID=A0A915IVX7_ROMCU
MFTRFVWILIGLFVFSAISDAKQARSMNIRRKSYGPTMPHFLNVIDYSWLPEDYDERGAKITKASHFAQSYKLGYKILLVCEAESRMTPTLKWYKDGLEMRPSMNTHFYEEKVNVTKVKAKVEIDPATIGDSGIYACLAGNQYSAMIKHFKVDYYF